MSEVYGMQIERENMLVREADADISYAGYMST